MNNWRLTAPMKKVHSLRLTVLSSWLTVRSSKLCGLFTLCFLLGSPDLTAQSDSHPFLRSVRDYRSIRLNLDDVDFGALQERVQSYRPTTPSSDVDQLIQSNFQFIFFNKLNKHRFQLVPEPQDIAGGILAVLKLNEQICDAIDTGLVLKAQEGAVREKRLVVQKVGALARQLRKAFLQYFVEVRRSSYTFDFRVFDTADGQFDHFLALAQEITAGLSKEIEHYFLNPAPGVVSVSDYKNATIAVLSESLHKMSVATAKKLKQ